MTRLTAFALILSTGPLQAAGTEQLREDVSHLASEELGGRRTGEEGELEAANYLAARLADLGALPLPGSDGFIQQFDFTAGSRDAGSTLSATAGVDRAAWSGEERVRALSFSDQGSVTAPLVFAGYGLVVPDGDEIVYDSYAGLDVEGKVVLVLRYSPEATEGDYRAQLSRYSGLRYKAMQARERGAAALLVVSGPASPNSGETVPMDFDTAISGSGIVAASVSGEVAAALLSVLDDGRDLAAVQADYDDGNPHAVGFTVPGVEVSLDVRIERERRTGHNVVGYLPGASASDRERPWIVLGAHYDHLGTGRSASSLADASDSNAVHYGADDNASGVAAVLAAGAQAPALSPERNVALAFWSGEELGLLGSTEFLRSGGLPSDQIAAYVNLDMVGRMRDNRLAAQGVGSSSAWAGVVERANVPVGFDLQIGEDPYLPTDSTAFNALEIPAIHLFTGSHEDYHKPSDTADKIAYDDLERVARFTALVGDRLADLEAAPEFVKVAPTREGGGDRDGLRAFTGTIPDYTTEVEGLRLSGVIEGGPAEEAGLTGGDVIVEFGGRAITNIYDYTYALDAVKIGEPILVVYLRDGERVESTLTPRSRD